MVPISTNEVWARSSSRKRAINPIDSNPTTGKNSNSKKKNTLREAMSRLRVAKAHTAISSACNGSARPRAPSARQLNEHLLQLGLAHPHVADDHALREERAQQLGQPLLGVVHRALDAAPVRDAAEHSGRLGEPGGAGIEAKRDDVADGDLALEVAGRPAGQDEPGLDERDLVAELLGLAHVVGGEHDGHA